MVIGEIMHVWGQEVFGKLYFSLNLFVKLNLLRKIKPLKKKRKKYREGTVEESNMTVNCN